MVTDGISGNSRAMTYKGYVQILEEEEVGEGPGGPARAPFSIEHSIHLNEKLPDQ